MRKPIVINGETPFQIEKRAFMLGSSASGYTLQSNPAYIPGEPIVDADWADYSDAIPANYQHAIECPAGVWWRLHGNTGDVVCQL